MPEKGRDKTNIGENMHYIAKFFVAVGVVLLGVAGTSIYRWYQEGS